MISAADCSWSLISVSYKGAATFSFKELLIYPHVAEWTPFQTHCYSENLAVPGIKPMTSGSEARNSLPLVHRCSQQYKEGS
jgi:hypothetical protein